jgi:ADP-ribosylglycohydrolase
MGCTGRRECAASDDRKIVVTIFDNLVSCKSGILNEHIAKRVAQAGREVMMFSKTPIL